VRRVAALGVWAYIAWVLLTWTLTAEQQLIGVLVAIAVGLSMAPLGDVAAPWRLLDPRRFVGVLRLITASLRRIVLANIELARRIWAPSRPLSSGMVIVPTQERTDGGLAATGLISSLIVDNQIVDIDRERSELQYHAVAVPHGNRQHPEDDINAPVERLLRPIVEEG
jgi:multicomponent Na+:H+ antiporter subunit E